MFRIAEAVRQNGKKLNGQARMKRPAVSMSKGLAASNQVFSAQKLYFNLVQYMEHVGKRVEQGKPFDMREGIILLKSLLRAPENVILELKKITLLSSHHCRLSIHAVNATIQAIQMGKFFEYEYDEMLDLATAALYHEIGMYTLPQELRKKEGRFSDEEFKRMQHHCDAGYEMIRQCGLEYDPIAKVVRQEHERYDGSGYPQKLKGDEIHEHASIIGIVDIYISMTQERPYRSRLLPAEAMKQIITNCKGGFSTKIMRKLLYLFSLYPEQSYIRLNNSSIGMVIKTDAMWPLKPTIKLIYDAQGKKLTEDTLINLSENPLLYIEEVISEAETMVFGVMP